MIELVIDKAGAASQRFKLGGGVYGMGRNATNEIVLDDKEVSRHHARLLVDGDLVLIEDLQSGNGTFVEGESVLDSPLQVGDSIEIMPFTLRLTDGEDDYTEEESEALCYLECIEGPLAGERFELEGDALSAGRSDEQDIALRDPSASRAHALFIHRGGGWTVRDNDSANGLSVNDQRLREARLRTGDEVQMGTTILRFVDPNAEEEDGLDLEEATLEANAFEVVGRQRAEQARARLLDEPAGMSPAAERKPAAAPATAAVDPMVWVAVIGMLFIGLLVVGLLVSKTMG